VSIARSVAVGRKRDRMQIEVTKVVADHQREAAWRLYNDAFEELRATAVQRHVMYRNEFDDVMADERVTKVMGFEGSPAAMAGLATYTNDLEAMPLISPEFFARRWPDLYEARRIWYLGFFAIHPDHRGTGIFEVVIENMWQVVLAGQGIALLDICRRNEKLGLPQAIGHTLQSLSPGATASRIDEQAYWLYTTPLET
jgi:GNAT superfamily N-acetyltransferase